MEITLKNIGKIFVITGLLLFVWQTPARANSTQITFEVPVSVTGFAADSFPAQVKVNCYISRNLPGGVLRLLGEKKLSIRLNPRNPQRLVKINVEARRGQIFKRKDVWLCTASAPKIEPLSSTIKVEGVL